MPSVPKSYQITIKHGGGPVIVLPQNTYTDTIFQVPAGKTWQVIRMMRRVPPPTEKVSLFRMEKASSAGVEQMVFEHTEPVNWIPVEAGGDVLPSIKDVTLEDQEMFRQIVKVPSSQTFFLVQYEMSVMEFT